MLELIEPLCLIFWSVVLILFFCDFGENVTTKFLAIDRSICACEWYLFPHQVQQMLPTIMMSTQKPVIFQGFGNVICAREAFKTVSDSQEYIPLMIYTESIYNDGQKIGKSPPFERILIKI